MPLTNAQLQARHRAKRKAQLRRYEAALREISAYYATESDVSDAYHYGIAFGVRQMAIVARAALQESSDA